MFLTSHYTNILKALVFSALALSSVVSAEGLIGSIQTSFGFTHAIEVRGNYAYTADFADTSTFSIVDISDPTNPLLHSELTINLGQELNDVALFGDYAYLAADATGLAVVDISDPANPINVFQQRDGAGFAHAIAIATINGTNYVFLTKILSNEILIYDISYPATPVLTKTKITVPSVRDHWDIAIDGTNLYAYSKDRYSNVISFSIFDVSDINTPIQKGILNLAYEPFVVQGEIRVDDNYAYIAVSSRDVSAGRLWIVDISNPDAPEIEANIDMTEVSVIPWHGACMGMDEDYAVIGGHNGFHVIDLIDPLLPVEVAYYEKPIGWNGQGARVSIQDGIAYTAIYGGGGVAIYELPKRGVEVVVDIKPGDDENTFNNNGHGVLPVAIIGTVDLDVRLVDSESLVLQGLSVSVKGKKLLAHYEDVNGDGIEDLLCQFEDSGAMIEIGDGYAELTGTLFDGTEIYGKDTIRIISK